MSESDSYSEFKEIDEYYYNKLRSKYITDLTTIKKFGNEFYKVSTMKIPILRKGENVNRKSKNTVNSGKLDNNLCRAKTVIKEYALCNDFTHFVTLTLDKSKYDRYNLSKYIKDLSQFIRDYRKKYKCDIQYLLIPEQHKDGAWHLHGLIKGINENHLFSFDELPSSPAKLKGKGYYNFELYSKKFGFCSLGRIKDIEKVSNYIIKYINKDLGKNIELGCKTYYNSRGLKKAETIKKGHLLCPVEYDFENDYCKIKFSNNIENIVISDI